MNHAQVERLVGVSCVVVNLESNAITPDSGVFGRNCQNVDSRQISQRYVGLGCVVRRANDAGIGSTIVKELSDALGQVACRMRSAKCAEEIGKAQASYGLVNGAFGGAPKERSNGSGDTGDRVNTARYLLNVDAWETDLYWHYSLLHEAFLRTV